MVTGVFVKSEGGRREGGREGEWKNINVRMREGRKYREI